jgi:DivIVA domain-containing protein
MGQYLLALVIALTVGAVIFGITVLVTGTDPGLGAAEPDGRAVPLPGNRPLVEGDVADVRFDTAVRGYRMVQVDEALRRAAYDIGYKDELIGVLESEVAALREGRTSDAEVLRRAREAALAPAATVSVAPGLAASAGDAPASEAPAATAATAECETGESGAPSEVPERAVSEHAVSERAVSEPGRTEPGAPGGAHNGAGKAPAAEAEPGAPGGAGAAPAAEAEPGAPGGAGAAPAAEADERAAERR